MDESGARALLERLSTTEQPPSRVDIGLARERGGTLLRRRRWALAGTPVLAAAAVVALVLGIGTITGGGAGPGLPPAAPMLSVRHPFNPLAPYAAFGWLPKGVPRRDMDSVAQACGAYSQASMWPSNQKPGRPAMAGARRNRLAARPEPVSCVQFSSG